MSELLTYENKRGSRLGHFDEVMGDYLLADQA